MKKGLLQGKRGKNGAYLTYTSKVCSDCGEKKCISEFWLTGGISKKSKYYRSYCKECGRRRNKLADMTRDKDKRREWSKKWRDKDESKKKMKYYHVKRKFGLSAEEYDYYTSFGRCYICNNDCSPCVDHCHNTGLVRGILCNSCNVYLGRIKDNIDVLNKMIEYIKNGDIRLNVRFTKLGGR